MKKLTKKVKVITIVSILLVFSITSGLIDLNRVKNGQEPCFTYKSWDNEYMYFTGLFYYFSGEIHITPTQPLSHSFDIKGGVWFFPGWKITPNEN